MTASVRFKLLAVYVPVAALGVLGLLYSVGRVNRQFEFNGVRSAWPIVEGRVVSSGASAVRYDRARKVNVGVTFTYVVEGREYSGQEKWSERDPIPLDFNFGAGSKAKAIKDRYSPGTLLPVYYNPSDPSQSLLRPSSGWPIGWLLLAIASGLVGLLGIAGTFILQFEPAAESGRLSRLRNAIDVWLPFNPNLGKRFQEWLELENERTRRQFEEVRQEHPELLNGLSRILSDCDPLGANLGVRGDDTYDYKWEAADIVPRLIQCSEPTDVAAVLHDEFDPDQPLIDEATFETVAEKVWEAWQEYKDH